MFLSRNLIPRSYLLPLALLVACGAGGPRQSAEIHHDNDVFVSVGPTRGNLIVDGTNLIVDGTFESNPTIYTNPSLMNVWTTDRAVAGTVDFMDYNTHWGQPKTGSRSGSCWTNGGGDCSLIQHVNVPTAGVYKVSFWAKAGISGAWAGVNINNADTWSNELPIRTWGPHNWNGDTSTNFQYYEYTTTSLAAGTKLSVWLYHPNHTPSSDNWTVIDDVSVAPTVTSVTLKAHTPITSLDFQTQVLLTATAAFSDGTSKDVTEDPYVTWTISPTNSAVLRLGHVLDALQTGPITVRATYQNVASNTLSFTFSLSGDPKAVMKLEMTPSTKILLKGAAADFQVLATYADKTMADVTSSAGITLDRTDRGTLTGAHFVSTSAGQLRLQATLNGVTSNSPQVLIYDVGDPNVVSTEVSPSSSMRTLSLGGATLTIPSSPVLTNTTVLLARYTSNDTGITAPFSPVGEAYLIDAGRSPLVTPASLTLTYAQGTYGTDQVPLMAVDHSNGWEFYAGTHNTTARTYTIQIDHFSAVKLGKFAVPTPTASLIRGVPFYDQALIPSSTTSGWCFVTTAAETLGFYGARDPYGSDMKRWYVAGMTAATPSKGLMTPEVVAALQRMGVYMGPYGSFFGAQLSKFSALSNLLSQAAAALDGTPAPSSAGWYVTEYIKSVVAGGTPVLINAYSLGHAFMIVGYDANYVYFHDNGGILLAGLPGSGTPYGRITWDDLSSKVFGRYGFTLVDVINPVDPSPAVPRAVTSDIYDYGAIYQDPATVDTFLRTTMVTDGVGHSRGYYFGNAGGSVPYSADLGYMSFPGKVNFTFRGWPVDVQLNASAPQGISMITRDARMALAIRDPAGNIVYTKSKDFPGITDARALEYPVVIDLQGEDRAFAQTFNKSGLYEVSLTSTSTTSTASADTLKMQIPFMALSSFKGTVKTKDASCNVIAAGGAVVTLPGLLNKDGQPASATADAQGNFVIHHVNVGTGASSSVQATINGYTTTVALPQPQIGALTNIGEITDAKPCTTGCAGTPQYRREGYEVVPFAWQSKTGYSCCLVSHPTYCSGSLTPAELTLYFQTNPGPYRCVVANFPSGPNMPPPGPGCTPDPSWNMGPAVGLVWNRLSTPTIGIYPSILPESDPNFCVIPTGYHQYICP